MKPVFVLLALTVTFVCGSVKQLREMMDKVDFILKNSSTEKKDSPMVTKLHRDVEFNCKPEFFCKAEKLLTEINMTSVDNLHRILKAYNSHHMKNCTIERGTEITLRSFLNKLKTCIQKNMHTSPPN